MSFAAATGSRNFRFLPPLDRTWVSGVVRPMKATRMPPMSRSTNDTASPKGRPVPGSSTLLDTQVNRDSRIRCRVTCSPKSNS